MSTKTANMVVKGDNTIEKILYPIGGGCKVHLFHTMTYGQGETHTIKDKLHSTINISKRHLDAKRAFDKHVAWSNFMLGVGVSGKELKDLNQKEQKAYDALLNKIEIDKIVFGGADDDPWVQLFATMDGLDGKKVKLETSQINYKNGEYPHMMNLEDCIEDIKTCANNYTDGIRENKQLNLFSQVPEKPQEAKAS